MPTKGAAVTETSAGAEVIRGLLPRRDVISAELVKLFEREIPELPHETRMIELLQARTAENVTSAMHAVANRASMVDVDAPPAALEYARRLAQRDIPITALVATAYDAERELWVGGKAALRQHWVTELLHGDSPDLMQAEGALRYRLHGWHLAVEAWIDGPHDSSDVAGVFDRLGAYLRKTVGAKTDHLMVPRDAREMRYWLPVAKNLEIDGEGVCEELKKANLPVRLAFGVARQGLEGFRSSAQAASRVKALSFTAGATAPAAPSFEAVAPMAILVDDPAELQAFVAATLNDLAGPDQRYAGLRESLLVFLESNRSYHEAARRLHVHRNTVHYRIQQAIEALGHDLGSDTFSLQLALAICKWHRLSAS